VQSHEVRRPLSNIMGLVQLMEYEAEQLSPDMQSIISMLKASSNELDAIIKFTIEKSTEVSSD